MFQFPSFAHYNRSVIRLHRTGLPHSEISGLKDICSYPKLIAACHVLHRLPKPRHPPSALLLLLYIFIDSKFQIPNFKLIWNPKWKIWNRNCLALLFLILQSLLLLFSLFQYVNERLFPQIGLTSATTAFSTSLWKTKSLNLLKIIF